MRPSLQDLHKARDKFSDLITNHAAESYFQQLFSQCPYILSEALPVRVSSAEIIPMGTPGKSEPDFIFYPKSNDSIGDYGVIEIKRPSTKILTKTRKNIVTLTRDAETAVSQGGYYLEKYKEEGKIRNTRSLVLGSKGHIFIIMGLSEQLKDRFFDELSWQQLEGRIPQNCRLLPYDIVLDAFTRAIPTRFHLITPSFESTCIVGIADGGKSFGNPFLSEFLSEILDEAFREKCSVFVAEHMDALYQKIREGKCHVPIIGFNPDIQGIDTVWPKIVALPEYQVTKFLFITNPLDSDRDGRKRLSPYFREAFDVCFGMPFSIMEVIEAIEKTFNFKKSPGKE